MNDAEYIAALNMKCSHALKQLDKALTERDAAIRERDEARAEADLFGNHGAVEKLRQRAEKAEAERDTMWRVKAGGGYGGYLDRNLDNAEFRRVYVEEAAKEIRSSESDVAARERDAAIKERDEARATLARLRAHCQVEGAAPKNYHCEHRECCWCGAGAGQ